MLNWIAAFLRDRLIQVIFYLQLSKELEIENSTPQGSVISPVLFFCDGE